MKLIYQPEGATMLVGAAGGVEVVPLVVIRDFPDGDAPRAILSLSDDATTVLDIRKLLLGSARTHLPAIGP